ncbi:BURP domain protein RD22 [Cardamine amara subsp. amara]|uniref:BURP domain protein RD22 n=1 Tax=Cardamine amara subsp. amara TaxID=228776 RepID=A0ABD1C4B8_CARAN
MAIRFPMICLLVSSMVMAIAADLPPERYWNTALPNTPIPNSLHHLLTLDFTDEKRTDVQVGKGGVNVNTGKGYKPGGGTSVNVGKGGVHVDAGKGKPGGGTHVSVSGGKGPGGGVNVNTGKPGKRTDVGVGKGGVIVHTRHKGKPVYVGVTPGPNPFVYQYAASETQLHDDPKAALFFLEKDLVPGKTMNVRFNTEDGYGGKTKFLPRGEVPFGSEKFSEILNRFSVKPGSEEAEMMKKTIEECEAKSVGGEEKYCATSLESMIDFTVSKLGKNHVRAVSTEVTKKNAPMQKYKIAAAGVKKLSDDKSVVCHKQKYPFAVFYCHKAMMTSVYSVPLEGENGMRAKAVAVCHKNTSAWNPNHLAFKVLKVKPGTVPVCHFLPETHVVWFSY